jgi:glutamate formiminotransferase / 5-formyltetrahydrofolate cyclo-ligase
VLECVVNVSEGRDASVIAALAEAGGSALLDVHLDRDHNRAVLTLAGPDVEDATRAVAGVALDRIHIRHHSGVHPRLGSLDVVPFVPLDASTHLDQPERALAGAIEARARFAQWAGDVLALPCFFYGPERSLPEVRRHAFTSLEPDAGPRRLHPTAGTCAVGARDALVAYNLWLDTPDLTVARAIAARVRGPGVRALGLAVAGGCQVSCNLIDPLRVGPAKVYDAVAVLAAEHHCTVARAELVGLAPAAVVEQVPARRRLDLDLDPERTVEARLEARRASRS